MTTQDDVVVDQERKGPPLVATNLCHHSQSWGEAGWATVLAHCGLDKVARLSSCPYPDNEMYM